MYVDLDLKAQNRDIVAEGLKLELIQLSTLLIVLSFMVVKFYNFCQFQPTLTNQNFYCCNKFH